MFSPSAAVVPLIKHFRYTVYIIQALTEMVEVSYPVFNFREHSTGPVKEVFSKSHLVIVVLDTPFAHSGVLPFLKPFVLHHGQYGHA